MDWQTVAEGDTGALGDVPTESGATYRLTIWLPFDVPDWAVGPIQSALGVFGTVEVAGSSIVLVFTAD